MAIKLLQQQLPRRSMQAEIYLPKCIFIAKEQPREDARLRVGSLIELCAIVPGAEKISNRCNIE